MDRKSVIRFDRRVAIVLGSLGVLLALATALGLNGSSVAIWNRQHPERAERDGLLAGTPRLMRSDEWGLVTPAVVSQARSQPAFDVANQRWGAGRVPLVMNLPARHWSLPFRPPFWGYFVVDLERAFAFAWHMKTVLLFGGTFLLLMLLTRSDFWVSLLGASWIYFSGFIQWWYSSPTMMPEMIGYFALAIVAAHYLVLAPAARTIVLASVVAAACLVALVLCLYPPFQVPLAYLGVAILAGSLVSRCREGAWRERLGLRLACAAAALAGAGVVLTFYYRDVASTLEIMRATVYPGERTSLGGDLPWERVFGGFHGFFFTESSYPAAWVNVCEASNFALLFPVALAGFAGRKGQTLAWCLAGYLALLLTWTIVGWPRWAAALSGFGVTHGARPLLGIGLASILLCCLYLARRDELPSPRVTIAVTAAWLLLLLALGFRLADFATPAKNALVVLGAGLAGYLLLTRRRAAFAALVLVPGAFAFGLVNPVAAGLGPILETRFFAEVSRVVRGDPDARWVVYGSDNVADLCKAAGAYVFNGTQVVPPLDDLRLLDPSGASRTIYNRYAHIEVLPVRGAGVRFELRQSDAYRIGINPDDEAWERLDIRYVVLPFEAQEPAFLVKAELVAALPEVGHWIYRYR
jgi:hypothetical protein